MTELLILIIAILLIVLIATMVINHAQRRQIQHLNDKIYTIRVSQKLRTRK